MASQKLTLIVKQEIKLEIKLTNLYTKQTNGTITFMGVVKKKNVKRMWWNNKYLSISILHITYNVRNYLVKM